MSKYLITIELDTEFGNPAKWDWTELVGEVATVTDLREIKGDTE